MKNIKFIFAALVSFAALSCQKLESPVENPDAGLMTLTLSTGEQTKTHISDVTTNGVTEIHWDAGDAIKVFTNEVYGISSSVGTNKYSFSMTESPKGNFAKFGGKVPKGTTKFWAVYPESRAKSGSTDGSNIVVSLPSGQDPVSGSFASNLNVSVAKGNVTENGGLGEYELTETILVTFKNVCSLLKFKAPADAGNISSVTITANKAIAGDMTINYSGDEPTVTVSGSNSITMTGTFEANKEYYFVVAPGDITGISMTIKTNNETSYITKKASISLNPGAVRSLGTVDLTKMTKVSASAAHQSPNNTLSGTNLTFNLAPNNNANVSSVSLKATNGTAKRNATAVNSSYTSDETWPYLPQGAYTFSGSFTYDGVNVTIPATSFTVPAPTFTVGEFAPFTSYSKYLENKARVANDLDGSTIYANVTASISSALLEKSEYGVKVNDKDPVFATVEGVKCVGFGGNEWKSHTVSQIKWTFDRVSVTKNLTTSQTVDVTGIPKRVTLYANESEAMVSGWSFNNVKWEAGKCILNYNGTDGNMISPEFYIPKDKTININSSYGAQYYVGFINIAGTDVSEFSADVRMGLTSGKSTVSTSYTSHTLPASKNPGESFYSFTDQFTLTTSSRYISIHHNSPTQPKRKPLFITYKADYWYINLQKVNVEYR